MINLLTVSVMGFWPFQILIKRGIFAIPSAMGHRVCQICNNWKFLVKELFRFAVNSMETRTIVNIALFLAGFNRSHKWFSNCLRYAARMLMTWLFSFKVINARCSGFQWRSNKLFENIYNGIDIWIRSLLQQTYR